MDTIMDNLKLVEEAINKSNYKDNVGVGISFMADSLYNPDQKKYELENPKQLLDVDQMVPTPSSWRQAAPSPAGKPRFTCLLVTVL